MSLEFLVRHSMIRCQTQMAKKQIQIFFLSYNKGGVNNIKDKKDLELIQFKYNPSSFVILSKIMIVNKCKTDFILTWYNKNDLKHDNIID